MKKLLGTLFTLILVLALAPTALAAKDADDVAYPVEGGNIYIDEATKTVTGADRSVTSAVIPDGITSIGYHAFYYCDNLTSVTIPNSVTSIGEAAFRNCTRLTSVTIPNSVTSIGPSAFHACTSMTSVTIPDSVTSIDGGAFWGCSSLTSLTIPKGITKIDSNMFGSCSSLTSVTIPDNIIIIEDGAFKDCDKLAGVTIPDSVTYIGWTAFARCPSLTSLTIPDSVSYIGDMAFGGCTSLTGLTVSGGNKSFVTKDGVLFTADGKELISYPAGKPTRSYTVPNGVTKITSQSFYDCAKLTSITIPNGVTIIDSLAFCECSYLTSIFVPASVTRISTGIDASFATCPSLTDIYYGGTEAQWEALKGPRSGYDPDVTTVHYNAAGLPAAAVGFTDLEDWSEDAVHWAVDNKFADARSVSVFGSDDACPRWEVVSILWKAMGSPEPTIASVPFTDVSPSAPYYKAVLWAYEQHITDGTTPTTFSPNDTVLRCDAMTFIYRAAKKPAVTASGSFKDVPAGQYFSAPIAWACKTGISNGTTPTTFSPNDPVTRAQMVTFLYRWAMLK